MSFRILAVSRSFPRPDFNAGDRRWYAMLGLMARSHRVDYALPFHAAEERDDRARETLRQAGVTNVFDNWGSFARALAQTHYHLVIFEFFYPFADLSDVLRERQPAAILVVDSVDVHFARVATAARLGIHSEADVVATRTRELAAYRAADAVIAVTEDDAEVLRREGGMPRLFLIPMVIPIRPRPERVRPPEVLFVGGFQHAPNIDAICWFVGDVWPLVRELVPDAILNIVGSQPPVDIIRLASVAGVRVLGYVPDTGPLLDQATVSIAPLRYGAGMKGKVNEALASGVPLVTTSFGVQGIPVVPGVHAALADHAEDFASAIVTLLRNPVAAHAMGVAGQAVAEAFTPERVEPMIDAMLRTLVPRPGAMGPRLRWAAASVRVMLRVAGRAAKLAQ